jgi:hypothetical protein
MLHLKGKSLNPVWMSKVYIFLLAFPFLKMLRIDCTVEYACAKYILVLKFNSLTTIICLQFAGNPSWGIAWYINDQLIPEIYVERGESYTFWVEGGGSRHSFDSNITFWLYTDFDDLS